MKSRIGPISPEAFYGQIGVVGGPDLMAFARWVVERAPVHGLRIAWGRSGPLMRFVHENYRAFPITFGQIDKSGVLCQRQTASKRRCREFVTLQPNEGVENLTVV
jgi:hypothetical protein